MNKKTSHIFFNYVMKMYCLHLKIDWLCYIFLCLHEHFYEFLIKTYLSYIQNEFILPFFLNKILSVNEPIFFLN